MDAGSGLSFERWNQPSPLKRMKVEQTSMETDTSTETSWSEEVARPRVRTGGASDSQTHPKQTPQLVFPD